jgi:HTH-type transcriptional regulator, quorum sensing regulator NprR
MEIGQTYKSAGKLVMARDYITRSLALYEMRDEQRLFGMTHQHLGKTLEKQNDFDGAEKEYREAITIEEELEDDVAASICHTSLAELLLKRGKKQEAEQEAQEALRFAKQSQNVVTQGQALMALAQIRHDAKDYAAADQLFTEALELLDASNEHEIAAGAYSRYAALLEQRNEVQRSLSAFKKAFEHQRMGNRGHGE